MKLTLSAYRTEPPLRPSFPPVGGLGLSILSLSRSSRAFLCRCRCLRVLSVVLVILCCGSSFRFGVGNGTSSTELNHVDGTFATRD